MRTSQPLHVAVVDDDESLCRSFARLLRASGMQPATYRSGEAFLADTKQPRFDCLVLDIRLEGMSGLDLARQLVARGSVVPFIFVTSSDEPESRAVAAALGCAAYLLKTDPGAAVLDAIRRVAI